MEEKIDKLYQKYLKEKLDLIFNSEKETNISVGESVLYDVIKRIQDGIYSVKKDGKWNLIDEKGNLLSNTWFDSIELFQNDIFGVRKDHKWNFLNKKGQILSDKWFDFISKASIEGYFHVEQNGKREFINVRDEFNYLNYGKPLLKDIWQYNICGRFEEGCAIVQDEGKRNLINTKGELLSDVWFDTIWNFSEGYAIVVKEGKYNFIDRKGQILSDIWYDAVSDFNNGSAKVQNDGKWNLVDRKGVLLSKLWFDDIRELLFNYLKVEKDNKYNFIDRNGNLVSNVWYDSIDKFKNGYLMVRKNREYNYIDENCQLVSEKWFSKNNISQKIRFFRNFIVFENGKTTCRKIDMDDYIVKKSHLLGYQCINSHDKYSLKYQPIKRFGFRYTLCLNKQELYLYDRISNEYRNIGNVYVVEYDDNFIFNRKDGKVYLMHENQMIEITDYYNNYLKDKREISITNGIGNILTREEFSLKNYQEIDRMIEEEREKNKKIKEEQEQQKKANELRQAHEEDVKREEIRKNTELKALKQLQDSLTLLKQVSTKSNPKKRIRFDNIFMQVGDHLEIPDIILSVLRYIDLSGIRFDNVKVEGIDFRGCNIDLNPQSVYKKSLKNCNLEDIFISPFINFSGIDIRGCKFSTDSNPMTLDIFNSSLKSAIYDETTTYNGISFIKIFGEDFKISGK